jgi:hypothetical protein
MWEAIQSIIGKAQSELFLAFILLVIMAVVTIRPALSYLKNKKEQETKREENILAVITDNSIIMAELKTLLKESNDTCKECKTEQLDSIHRMEKKHDDNALVLNDISHGVKEMVQAYKNPKWAAV